MKSNWLAAFPPAGERLHKHYDLQSLRLRAFGSEGSDLGIDFEGQQKPHCTTAILQKCTCDAAGRAVPEDFFWDLTLGRRLQALWQIVFLCHPGSMFLQITCPNPGCKQKSEIELSAPELNQLADTQEHETVKITLAKRTLTLRRARGRDQRAWLSREYASQEEVEQTMIHSLLSREDQEFYGQEHRFSGQDLERINEGMAAFEPLLFYLVKLACPYCGKAFQTEIDLEDIALQQLRRALNALFYEVHTLAKAYHWSERSICDLPQWRRRKYLRLLSQG